VNALTRFSFSAGTVLLALVPQPLLACATCFGKSDDLMAQGMNMGIFALLIVITLVLAGIASVGIFFARRSARLQENTILSQTSASLSVSQSNQ
jgi:hypothetical protein